MGVYSHCQSTVSHLGYDNVYRWHVSTGTNLSSFLCVKTHLVEAQIVHFKGEMVHVRNVKNAFMPKSSISQPNTWCFALQVLKNEGTVTAAANFNPSEDAAVLEKAIKVKGDRWPL